MGTLTESMLRLQDEIVALRKKRSLAQTELIRVGAERRASVAALRTAFSRDRALARRAWFGPTATERSAAERQKERRLAEEAKALALAEQQRKLTEEAKALALAEQQRKLAEEARVVAHEKHERRLAEEAKVLKEAEPAVVVAKKTVEALPVPQAAQERDSSDIHAASRKHKASHNKALQHKASQHKASKTHSSK